MLLIGLTGSIGMGKSTAAAMLHRRGLPVHDADAAVHGLMGGGGRAVPRIDAAFPGVVIDGAVDRGLLGKAVFGDPAALRRLESILHPMVREEEQRFLKAAARRGCRAAVLDVPLLFETGGDRRVDTTILVTAPAAVQAARVLRRPGMTRERLASILARQMPDREKRRRAEFVVMTGLGKRFTLNALLSILRELRGRPSLHWPPRAIRFR